MGDLEIRSEIKIVAQQHNPLRQVGEAVAGNAAEMQKPDLQDQGNSGRPAINQL